MNLKQWTSVGPTANYFVREGVADWRHSTVPWRKVQTTKGALGITVVYPLLDRLVISSQSGQVGIHYSNREVRVAQRWVFLDVTMKPIGCQ